MHDIIHTLNNHTRPTKHRPLPRLKMAVLSLAVCMSALTAAAGNLHQPIEASASPVAKGLAIAKASDLRDEGWGDWTANAEMILRNQQGQSSTRQMKLHALEQPDQGDKRLIVFDEPRDIKGTSFLVFTKKEGLDDQWLYLPALKRVKRISSSNQSGPFVGSEFAYEDLSSQEVEKYHYQYLREEPFQGMDCYVVERIPTNKKSGYSRQVVWIDKQEFRNTKTEYYDRKGAHLKTFIAHDYREYPGNYWRADRFEMNNHQTGKSTTLKWSQYEFTQGLKDRDFDRNSLKNARR